MVCTLLDQSSYSVSEDEMFSDFQSYEEGYTGGDSIRGSVGLSSSNEIFLGLVLVWFHWLLIVLRLCQAARNSLTISSLGGLFFSSSVKIGFVGYIAAAFIDSLLILVNTSLLIFKASDLGVS